jgi:outer membrane protein TolC
MFFILLSLTFVMNLSAQKVMSLSDAIDYALANHPEVRIAKLNVKDAEWQIRENKSVALPHLSLGVNYNYFIEHPAIPAELFGFGGEPGQKLTFALRNNLSGKAQVTQLLFDNDYFVGLKAVKLYREYVDLQLNSVKEKVRNNVRDAYMPALLLTKSVEILDKNIENQQKLFNDTKAVYKAGFAEQLDVDRLEFILFELRTEHDNLLRQKETVIDLLKFAMNIPVKEEITLSDDLDALLNVYTSIDPDEEIDYMNRPDYLTVLKSMELNQIQVDLYKKNWLPTVSFFASYDPSFQGNSKLYWIPSAIAGISLNMPIYDGGFSKAKQERAKITAMEVTEQKDMMLKGFDLEIENARNQFKNARQKVEDQERNLDLAERINNSSQIKFKAGVGSSLEITQAQSGLYQAQGNLINARYELLKSIVALKKALGKE